MPRNPQCNLCKRHSSASKICIWGNGNHNSTKEIMVIIDNISYAQDNTGMLLQGQGGNVLHKLLIESGIIDITYVTSAIKCYASHKPLANEIKSCRNYLLEEIDIVKPKLIICLGSVAAKAIFNKHFPAKELRQRFFQFGQSVVACSYSHNIIFTEPSKFSTIKRDINWILNNFRKTTDKLDYTIKVDQSISIGNVYGLDIETSGKEGTGLNPYKGKILTIAISNPITKESVGYNIGHNEQKRN